MAANNLQVPPLIKICTVEFRIAARTPSPSPPEFDLMEVWGGVSLCEYREPPHVRRLCDAPRPRPPSILAPVLINRYMFDAPAGGTKQEALPLPTFPLPVLAFNPSILNARRLEQFPSLFCCGYSRPLLRSVHFSKIPLRNYFDSNPQPDDACGRCPARVLTVFRSQG